MIGSGLTDGPNDQSAIAMYLMHGFRAHVGFTHNITRVRTLPAMKLPTKKRSVGKRHQQICQKQVSLVVADRSITLTVKIGKNTEVVVEKLAV